MLLLLTVLLLSGCVLVSFEDYVHDETQEARQSINWGGGTRGLPDRALVIVPDFRQFTRSFPNPRAHLIVVTRAPQTLHIESATVRNMDSGKMRTLHFPQPVEVRQPLGRDGHYRGYLPLLEKPDFADFSGAAEIRLEVVYATAGGRKETRTFLLKRKQVRDFAWVT
jgi:hypothetical protein